MSIKSFVCFKETNSVFALYVTDMGDMTWGQRGLFSVSWRHCRLPSALDDESVNCPLVPIDDVKNPSAENDRGMGLKFDLVFKVSSGFVLRFTFKGCVAVAFQGL